MGSSFYFFIVTTSDSERIRISSSISPSVIFLFAWCRTLPRERGVPIALSTTRD